MERGVRSFVTLNLGHQQVTGRMHSIWGKVCFLLWKHSRDANPQRWWMGYRLSKKQRHQGWGLNKQNKHNVHATGHQEVDLVLCLFRSQNRLTAVRMSWVWGAHGLSDVIQCIISGFLFLRPKDVVSYGEPLGRGEHNCLRPIRAWEYFHVWAHSIKKALVTVFPTFHRWHT